MLNFGWMKYLLDGGSDIERRFWVSFRTTVKSKLLTSQSGIYREDHLLHGTFCSIILLFEVLDSHE